MKEDTYSYFIENCALQRELEEMAREKVSDLNHRSSG